ncbi:MalY/PatB family protein [Peptacetobacter sp.]|uniref:MalY/PatB family protein n=1 Tax=Peptacetobacter sp. TaxID=2991975 RepID=UPI0026116990|nr:PatB family C-S lyase [Peptacetobacter sp.]
MKYNFDKINNRKGTYCTQWDYIQDRFGVEDILPFSISDTDFIVPYEVTEKLKSVLEHQIFGYTRWNHDDFKNSIVNFFKKRFDTEVKKDWVIYSPSVMYSVSLLIKLLSKDNDIVATFNPMYDAFFNVIEGNNRKIGKVDLIEKDGKFYIDFNKLEEMLKKSKLLLLCSPHNPTGKVFTEKELVKIVKLCKKYSIKIISDEIHMDIILGEKKHNPIIKFLKEYNDLYLVSSGSKTFNYPALICSYAIIPNDNIKEEFLTTTRKKEFLNSASIPGMYATMISYNECDDYIEELVAYINKNMDYVEKYIKENIKDLKFKKPEGTYLAWIDCRKLKYSSEELQDVLVNIGKVGIMKGEVYGGEKYLRLNCGCSIEKLKLGLEKLKNSIEYLKLK